MIAFKDTDSIPWKSFGRETKMFKLGKSLLPVGGLPFEPIPPEDAPKDAIIGYDNRTEGYERYVMRILGTAFQAGEGKFVTCGHVVDAYRKEKHPALLNRAFLPGGDCAYVPCPIIKQIRYFDPRHNAQNPNVDLAIILGKPGDVGPIPWRVPSIRWGDSRKLGVGDRVCVGGYPLGTNLFFMTNGNRGIIQPTFYDGIISAILPATSDIETRLIQVSIPVCGGISGGVLFRPEDCKVYGMVTSGVTITTEQGQVPLPMTYAIPSEIIQPFVDAITSK